MELIWSKLDCACPYDCCWCRTWFCRVRSITWIDFTTYIVHVYWGRYNWYFDSSAERKRSRSSRAINFCFSARRKISSISSANYWIHALNFYFRWIHNWLMPKPEYNYFIGEHSRARQFKSSWAFGWHVNDPRNKHPDSVVQKCKPATTWRKFYHVYPNRL